MEINAARLERVRSDIERAFSGFEPPPAEEIVYIDVPQFEMTPEAREQSRASAESCRKWLAGRRWEDLRPAVLTEQELYAFCYLTPIGFAYYIPAALLAGLAALENPRQFDIKRTMAERPSDPKAVQAFYERYGLPKPPTPNYEETVERISYMVPGAARSLLGPDSSFLYSHGSDPAFNAKRQALSDRQTRAICAYLGLFLNSKRATDYAQILTWGWADVDCDETREAARLIRALTNYDYAAPWPGRLRHPACPEIAEAIRMAFRGRPLPRPDRIVEPSCDPEVSETGLTFRGVEWDKVHPSLLLDWHLSFFTREAHDYFCISWCLAHAHGSVTDTLSGLSARWFPGLTGQQQEAVIRYLQWRAAAATDPYRSDAERLFAEFTS